MDAYAGVDDDGVTVEDESESFESEKIVPEVPGDNLELLHAFILTYPWHILFTLLAVVLVFVKYLLPKYRSWQLEKEDAAQTAQFDNDPEFLRTRSEAMELARRRLQEQHDQEAERFREKQKEREEAKRQEKVLEWERHIQGKGYHSKYKPPEQQAAAAAPAANVLKKKPKLRDDFNPLMGNAGDSRFRPSSRDCSSSGG